MFKREKEKETLARLIDKPHERELLKIIYTK
jgi:hypothetical protein